MKTKALISCIVTTQLICVFVFAYAKHMFTHNAAHSQNDSFLTRHYLFILRIIGSSDLITLSFYSIKVKLLLLLLADYIIKIPQVDFVYRRHKWKNVSLVVRKPAFCICENKDAGQLRSNREADQRLCFRYSDSMIPLLSKSKISRL